MDDEALDDLLEKLNPRTRKKVVQQLNKADGPETHSDALSEPEEINLDPLPDRAPPPGVEQPEHVSYMHRVTVYDPTYSRPFKEQLSILLSVFRTQRKR